MFWHILSSTEVAKLTPQDLLNYIKWLQDYKGMNQEKIIAGQQKLGKLEVSIRHNKEHKKEQKTFEEIDKIRHFFQSNS